jgi:hypothetical protein
MTEARLKPLCQNQNKTKSHNQTNTTKQQIQHNQGTTTRRGKATQETDP